MGMHVSNMMLKEKLKRMKVLGLIIIRKVLHALRTRPFPSDTGKSDHFQSCNHTVRTYMPMYRSDDGTFLLQPH
jgi:hypothetical protein